MKPNLPIAFLVRSNFWRKISFLILCKALVIGFATLSYAEKSSYELLSKNLKYIAENFDLGAIENEINDLNFTDDLDLSLAYAISYYHNVRVGSETRAAEFRILLDGILSLIESRGEKTSLHPTAVAIHNYSIIHSPELKNNFAEKLNALDRLLTHQPTNKIEEYIICASYAEFVESAYLLGWDDIFDNFIIACSSKNGLSHIPIVTLILLSQTYDTSVEFRRKKLSELWELYLNETDDYAKLQMLPALTGGAMYTQNDVLAIAATSEFTELINKYDLQYEDLGIFHFLARYVVFLISGDEIAAEQYVKTYLSDKKDEVVRLVTNNQDLEMTSIFAGLLRNTSFASVTKDIYQSLEGRFHNEIENKIIRTQSEFFDWETAILEIAKFYYYYLEQKNDAMALLHNFLVSAEAAKTYSYLSDINIENISDPATQEFFS